jgi:S-formylglutathione hydrolase FrmB
MNPMRRLVALVVVLIGSAAPAAEPFAFRLTFDQAALDEPFTGRVFVLLTRAKPDTLPRGLNWFAPEPAFATDVADWKPGTPLTVGPEALAHPTPLADLKPGTYWATAVLDRDLGGISFSAGPGNVYSKPVQLDYKPGTTVPLSLSLDQVYREPPFQETDTVKLVTVESTHLTQFHGKPTRLRAGVILPPSFAKEPDRKYPVVYEVPGFSGTHGMAHAVARRKPWDVAGVEMIWVVLDPSCRLGHHVFADSANNGPVGQALTEEFLPHLEKAYRGAGKRFVTGHSSGGWSSLWLQVSYPDVFHGCWSTSPDPVDFRDFQQVDVYAPGANVYTASSGDPRPLSRPVGGRRLFFRSFCDMEALMGHGGQLASFEAVFGPRGKDGKPVPLWDRKTGAVDPAVAKAWERYDIRLKLEREWKDTGRKLAGKIHVYMGDEDTFYLDGAARLLKASVADLKADAVVELFPNKSHNLVDVKLRERMNQEMAVAYKKQP